MCGGVEAQRTGKRDWTHQVVKTQNSLRAGIALESLDNFMKERNKE